MLFRSTGFVGPNSEVQWLRRLKEGAKSSSQNTNVVDSTFYLDSDNLELDILVDPDELPSDDMTELLFKTYIFTVTTYST